MPPSEFVDVLAAPDPLAFLAAAAPDDLLAFRTAGTAGQARTVLRASRSWTASYPHISDLLDMTHASRVWVPGPLSASMNFFAAAHASWAGAEVVASPAHATHAHLTPWVLRRQLADDPAALSGLHLVVAGDRLSSSLREAAVSAGARVSHYYGAAELSFVAWGQHAGSLRPFPGVDVTARDGELWVRSPYVCEGYAEPEQSLRRDPDGWLTVGDRGHVQPNDEGGLVTVFGRSGGVTTAGATVLEADIEHALRREASGEVAVVGVPHPDLGQVVAAVVTDRDDVGRLQEVSRRVLAPQQRPRRWFHLASLPLTGNGKVDKAAIVRVVATDTKKTRETKEAGVDA
jgi:acyl-CoA synthetase (AMP-forming)/AMP-acid ligase II